MRLVKLNHRTVAIANQVSANSLWKDSRPYLCIPMRKNANVFHIIPFRTSKRKPKEGLVNTLYFPLKYKLAQNQDGEYPYLDLSKSFLVRQNHFVDLPADWRVEGYMRAAEGMNKLHGMSLRYITKMNSGKLDGVKKTFCVDYVAILQALDEQLPLNEPIVKKEPPKISKTKAAVAQEMNQIYAEIESELFVSNKESVEELASEAAISAASATVSAVPLSKKAIRNAEVYNTTTADIRAVEASINNWNKWLESSSWDLNLIQQERDEVYAEVKVDNGATPASNKDILKEMHEEIYSETVFNGDDEKADNVD